MKNWLWLEQVPSILVFLFGAYISNICYLSNQYRQLGYVLTQIN